MSKKDLEQKVWKHAEQLVEEVGYVSAIDVLVRMKRLTTKQVEDWRFGRIPYLEKVVLGNLGKMSTILQSLSQFAKVNNLKPSKTYYKKWGKGPKSQLRFSKSNAAHLEEKYATHYVK